MSTASHLHACARLQSATHCWSRLVAAALVAVCCLPTAGLALDLSGAEWIWISNQRKNQSPAGTVYFRKSFFIGRNNQPRQPERGRLEITADDRYEVFLNGRRVGGGENFKVLGVFDVSKLLQPGANTIAVAVQNNAIGPAGLVARLTFKEVGNTDLYLATNKTWKASLRPQTGWQSSRFNDTRWTPVQSFGAFGEALPWGKSVQVAEGAQGGRFKTVGQFRVEQVIKPEETESLLAMTFDQYGRILASREGGPLLRIEDRDRNGMHETVIVLTDKLTNCQGLLVHENYIFAVGNGPDGAGLYRLEDKAGNDAYETLKLLFKFEGGIAEHGPHGLVLGPDGLLYLVVGNHAKVNKELAPTSPHHHFYEGDLVQPRYEDAGGHAVGVKAPGCTVLRTDLEGKSVEQFAGGLRNAYDLGFNLQGDLFTYDSDMEWDEGLPWYRATRVYHIIPGAEFGWRSGWAKWPEYFVDGLPPSVETGRGSPTGVTVYNHYKYPVRYHNSLFACDWSGGRILAISCPPTPGSYSGETEVFLEGRPLNVTDIEVGPDGWLYFVTGGRDTEGGLYRIVWDGNVPPRPQASPIETALRQPQLLSAWSLKRIELIKEKLGDDWRTQLAQAAYNPKQPLLERVQAIDIMQLIGPPPSHDFLVYLSKDDHPLIRAKAAFLMGIHANEATNARLVELLDDPVATVRRKSIESLVSSGGPLPNLDKLMERLDDSSRHVRWAAATALKRVAGDDWRDGVLAHESVPAFNTGAAALLAVEREPETAKQVIARVQKLLQNFVSDADFAELLRVTQLALLQGGLKHEDVPTLRDQLAKEYPLRTDKNPEGARSINRELVRVLVYLQDPTLAAKIVQNINGTEPLVERMHAAFYARFLTAGWTTEDKLALLTFYESARELPGGHSLGRYVENFTRDFFTQLTPEEREQVLAAGKGLPGAAVYAVATMPVKLSDEQLQQLIDLDQEMVADKSTGADRLRTAVHAVLGRSGQPEALSYLRETFAAEPTRRPVLAIALAEHPGGENWPLLVGAVSLLEGQSAGELFEKLALAEERPETPGPIRQVIIRGLKMGDDAAPAVKLLQAWTGETLSDAGTKPAEALALWQGWFAENYPDEPPAEVIESPENKWSLDDVLSYLASDEGQKGDATKGALVFEKAQCIKCHRFGNRGEGVGPDLTTISRRFHPKELIESVIFPSLVISDQYRSQTVTTVDGRQYTGIVGASGAEAVVILQANAEKKFVLRDDIDEIVPHAKSAMPDGLFNELTLEEIADLFSYLNSAPPAATAAGEKPQQPQGLR